MDAILEVLIMFVQQTLHTTAFRLADSKVLAKAFSYYTCLCIFTHLHIVNDLEIKFFSHLNQNINDVLVDRSVDWLIETPYVVSPNFPTFARKKNEIDYFIGRPI